MFTHAPSSQLSRRDRQWICNQNHLKYDKYYEHDWWKCKYYDGDCCHPECKPVPTTRQPVINEKPVQPVKKYNPPSKRVDVTDSYLRG